MARLCLFATVLLVGIALIPGKQGDAPPRADLEPAALNVCLEIQALRILYLLRVTPEQSQKLQELAKALAIEDREREKPRMSDEYRRVLLKLHEALLRDNEDKVEELEDRLAELTESESPELDDAVPVTPAARRRVAEALRILHPQQLATFLGSIADEIGDPQQRLVTALEEVRSDKLEDWEGVRDDLADDLGWLLGGLNVKRSKDVSDEVVALLTKARNLTDASYTKQKAKLENQARAIGADVGPTEVLQHAIDRTLARLLSNPRLDEALQGRRK
jgi:hypothetical protein